MNRNLKKIEMIEQALESGKINYNIRASNGDSLLHVLGKHYKHFKNPDKLVNIILEKNYNLINTTNNDGQTPIIVATKHGNHELTNYLIENGADRKIRSKFGEIITTDNSETETVFEKGNGGNNNLKLLLEQNDTTYSGTLNYTDNKRTVDKTDTDNFVDTLVKQHDEKQLVRGNQSDYSDVETTEQLVNTIINKMVNKQDQQGGKDIMKLMNADNTKTQKHGEVITGTRGLYDTGTETEQFGGTIEGTRELYDSDAESTSVSAEEGSRKKKKQNKRLRKYGRQLSRLLNNQTKEVFNRIMKKIMDLMNIDYDTARIYKTTLIHTIHQKDKTIQGLDLANEVEKMVTKDVLKKIDVDKEREKIAQWHEKKKGEFKKQIDTQEPNKKTKDKKGKKGKKDEDGYVSSNTDSDSSSSTSS